MPLYEMGITFGRLSKASTYWDWILPAVSSVLPEVPIAVKRIAFDDIVKEEVIEETAGRMTRAMLEAWNTSQVYDPPCMRR